MKKKDRNPIIQKSVKIVTVIVQVLIILTMIWSIVGLFTDDNKDVRANQIFLSIMGLLLLNVPSFISRKWRIYIPSNLQILAVIFIFAHFILGEIFRVYDYSLLFDKILHTTSGLAFAAVGFSLVNLLNESKNTHLELSPFFVALFSFCFSMMIAGVWEIFEFTMDSITGGNMQRWQIIGDILEIENPGRVGLIDTMGDIIVCLIGSFIVSAAGYISLKTKGNWLNRIMIRSVKDLDKAKEEAMESHDVAFEKIVEELEEIKEEEIKEEAIKEESLKEEAIKDIPLEPEASKIESNDNE